MTCVAREGTCGVGVRSHDERERRCLLGCLNDTWASGPDARRYLLMIQGNL